MAQYHYTEYKFQAACCDFLMLKSKDENFPKEIGGTYEVYLDIEFDQYKCYNATVFKNTTNGHYLYRSKYGDWVIGTDMGKMKRGAKLRSFDLDEKEKFLRTCPCKVDKWKRRVVGEDGQVRWRDCEAKLMIRRQKVSIPCGQAGS